MKDYCVATTLKGTPFLLSRGEVDSACVNILKSYRDMRRGQGENLSGKLVVRYNPLLIVVKTEDGAWVDYTNLLSTVLDVERAEFDNGWEVSS